MTRLRWLVFGVAVGFLFLLLTANIDYHIPAFDDARRTGQPVDHERAKRELAEAQRPVDTLALAALAVAGIAVWPVLRRLAPTKKGR